MNCSLILLIEIVNIINNSFNKISLIYSAVLITAVISDYLLFFSDNTLIYF